MVTDARDLSENTKAEIVSIATASLITWDSMSEEERSQFANVEEFTGYMVLSTAHQLIHEEDEEDWEE